VPDRWDVVATLVDASRRALFEYVRRQDHPVGREEAAAATGLSRGLAAFHLDKLVEAGLLGARYEAPAGPRGRGRTPKVYVPSGDVTITIPARRDDLIADVLASAYLSQRPPDEVAFAQGTTHGVGELGALGFEPRDSGEVIVLGNCPFHALAARHGSLICGIATAFVAGMASGAPGYEAIRSVEAGGCCVALRRPGNDVPPSERAG
jgi:predicted ArsR family transcriptional regulator